MQQPRQKRRRWVPLGVASVLVVAAGAVWMLAADRGSEPAAPTGAADDHPGGDGGDRGDPQPEQRLIEVCGESDLREIPGTDVSIEPMTLEQERDVGTDVRASVFEFYATSDDSATQSALDDLLDEVAPAGSAIPFTVTLLDSDEVNAFAIPGGDLFFTRGITSLMTNDELAFVMGHEVAHVACRHLAKQFEREALVAAGIDALLGAELDTGRLYADAAAEVLTGLAGLSFSREDETQSDVVALDLLTEAGRPLDAGPSALRVLQSLEGGAEASTFEVFLSTHPPTGERIANLETEISGR